MLEKNLQALKLKSEILYEKISTHILSDKYKVVNSKNGMFNLLTSDNKYMHSKYDPDTEAGKWADNILVEEDSIFILGIGLGYYLHKIFDKYPDKVIFIVEPDIEIFIHALCTQDLTKELKSEKVILLIDLNKDAISAILREYLYYDAVKTIYFTQIPYYQSFKKDYVKETHDSIYKSIYELRSDIATKLYFANMWMDNTIRNLKYMKDDLNSINLQGLARDIPVIIVSAGPSLEKNVELLKTLYNKAIIIAVGSAVNILESRQIIPHFVMGIDGSEAEARIFNSMKNTESIFLYAPTVHYKATEGYAGRRSWFALNVQSYIIPVLNQNFKEYATIISGYSVANIALDFVHNVLNSKKVIFIGQDLAYTNNMLYAKGAVQEHLNKKERDYSKESYVTTQDIYGRNVYTRKTFLNMKNWFEDYINTFKLKGQVYNCTEGGLNIEGMINMEFLKVIEKFCIDEYKIDMMISERYDKGISKDTGNNLEFLLKFKNEIEELVELSKDRIELLTKVIDDTLNKENIRFNKKFDNIIKLGKKIEKKLTYQYFINPLLKTYIDITTFAVNRELQEENKDKVEGLKTLLSQYIVIDNSIKVAKRALENN